MSNRFELVDLFDPVFNEVCALNRLWRQPGEAGQRMTIDLLKQKWRTIFQLIDKSVRERNDPRLLTSYVELRPAVIHFVDEFIIRQHRAELGAWNVQPLATDPILNPAATGTGAPGAGGGPVLVGGDHFFEIVRRDVDSAVQNPSAKERLAVYYVCLGMGFRGKYYNNPQALESVVASIHQVIPDYVHSNFSSDIFGNRHQPYVVPMPPKPTHWIPWAVVTLVILSIVLLVGYFTVYYGQYGELREMLSDVRKGN